VAAVISPADFLMLHARRAHAFGTWDCAFAAAEYGRAVTGIDFAAPFRGRYRTALGCARVLRREGGIATIFAAVADQHRVPRVDEPAEGDLGIIAFRQDDRDCRAAAIRLPMGWAWLLHDGRWIISEAPHVLGHVWRLSQRDHG